MKILSLFKCAEIEMSSSDDIFSGRREPSLRESIDAARAGQDYLLSLNVDDIIGCIGQACAKWALRDNAIQRRYAKHGLNFLLYWFREAHLRQALDFSLRGDRKILDGFQSIPGMPFELSAQPRGLICHWLAGNVPMLGMLSLVQGLLTKNANLIRVSRQNGEVIPNLLESFQEVVYVNSAGRQIHGRDLIRSVSVVYFESDEREAQVSMSSAADVRVAWGGREAVEAIMNLPRNYGCDDVILGPKTSFMVIGKECLRSEESARTLARRSSIDASLFDQQGCNSPHTVFVEAGGEVSPADFAKLLGSEMEIAARQFPRDPSMIGDTMKVLTLRAQYDMIGDAYYSKGLDWTVLFSENDEGLAIPCYGRTVFVRPVRDVFEVEKYCSHLTQSCGVALSPQRKREFARRVSLKGIDRCPEIGSMTAYDIPWDGMFIMDRFVRWCKL